MLGGVVPASSKTQTGVVLGTPGSLSPEQLAGQKPFQREAEHPQACRAMIDRALHKDPAQGYQRGREIEQDASACMNGLPG